MADDKEDRGKVRDMAEAETPQLPVDVIIHIMSYLSVSDRMSAGLANQTWREASLALKFVDQQVLVFNIEPPTEKFRELLSVLQHSTRPFLHFAFYKAALKRNMVIWEQYGPSMKSLHLLCCELNEKTLVDILKCCTSLRVLRINGCREYLKSGRLLEDENDANELAENFVHLKELNLDCSRFLNNALFNRLVGICPNLESLSLMECHLVLDTHCENSTAPNSSWPALTLANIEPFLRRQGDKLKHLNFGDMFICDPKSATLSALEGLKLDSLILADCYRLGLNAIRDLARHQTSLKVLDISFSKDLTDSSLICICRYLKRLEVLRMKKCKAITNFGIWHVSLLKDLKELDISDNRFLNGEYVVRGLCCKPSPLLYTDQSEGGRPLEYVIQDRDRFDSVPVEYIRNEKLERFCAYNVIYLGKEAVPMISLFCPNLRELDLSPFFNTVTDETMRMIAKNLVRLQILKVNPCYSVSDEGLIQLNGTTDESELQTAAESKAGLPAAGLKVSLRSRAEEEIARKTDRTGEIQIPERLDFGQPLGFSFSRLRCLRELDIALCQITDISLIHAFAFPELRVLNLTSCKEISDVGLISLSQRNPAIEELNLSFCSKITDIGISFLVKRLHRLRGLHIRGCCELTNDSLRLIQLHCRNLRYLDMRCPYRVLPPELEAVECLRIKWMNNAYNVPRTHQPFCSPAQRPWPYYL